MADDLIPVAVRIALRNAVGGWGPYSLAGIDDLFNSHGFSQRDETVDDAGGARRTRAEQFHARINFGSPDEARRYLDLIGEVLDHYPEEVEEPDPVGQLLRKRLSSAGIGRDAQGRLLLPGLTAGVAEQLNDATEGVWTPDRIRVFISHTSAHRVEVGSLAAVLNRYGFSCFVAHDAIEPTREWQDVIELALRTCDLLLAYVTPDFRESQWTDQEVGWALGREVVIIPLRVGADPYGFSGAYQGLSVPAGQSALETALGVARAIAVAIFRHQRAGAARLVDRMTDLVVEAFCLSSTFETVRRRFELLKLIPRAAWKLEHFDRLDQAVEDNHQIREAGIDIPSPRPAPQAIAELREAVGFRSA